MQVVDSLDIAGSTYRVNVDQLVWRPSAYGVVVKDSAILLTKQHGSFHLPGGGVEKGEQLEDTVLREIYEETGIKAKNPRLITAQTTFFTYLHPDTGDYVHNQTILLFYFCEYVGGRLSMDGFEVSERAVGGMPEWVPVADLKHLKSNTTYDWQSLVIAFLKTLENTSATVD